MPIAALPLNTVLAIGSTQALSDSASLVKELVDNALDARASAIFIEISVNALDVIQVKDNGHGIAPNDRSLVGRRYCTSKISEFEDLINIGGVSLGFRGEALASAIELSECMTLTTRVESEQVAASMKFNSKGEIVSQQTVSHPVGTTVGVAGFLKNLPVRRQTALRSSVKIISKIKDILESYALARPSVRFSLKILKTKNDKGNWIYAPKIGASVMDAAMKLLDQKAVMQCKWQVWSSPKAPNPANPKISGDDEINPDSTRFSIEALLPRSQSDMSAVSHVGQYISIDSRPMSCNRGTLKQIVSLYKKYVRSGGSQLKNMDKLVDPILCLNIVCPPGSYDANIEPAKDDVLFTHPGMLLDIMESFFKDTYGELSDAASRNVESRPQRPKQEGFELLLNRKALSSSDAKANTEPGNGNDGNEILPKPSYSLSSPNTTSCTEITAHPAAHMPLKITQHIGTAQRDENSSSKRDSTWMPNMYEVDSDEGRTGGSPEDLDSIVESESDDEEKSRNIRVSNPWIMAKMNAPIHTHSAQRPLNSAAHCNGQLLTPVRQRGEIRQADNTPHMDVSKGIARSSNVLPSPGDIQPEAYHDKRSPSPDHFNFPIRAWGPGNRPKRTVAQNEQVVARPTEGALDGWVRKDPVGIDGFVSARTLPVGTPLDAIPEISQRPHKEAPSKRQPKRVSINQPFKSPVNDPHCVWFDIEPARRPNASWRPQAHNNVENTAATAPIQCMSDDEASAPDQSLTTPDLPSPIHPDLAVTLDYEVRKQAAMQKRKDFLRQQARDMVIQATVPRPSASAPPNSFSPHKNRYNSAIAALTTTIPTAAVTTSSPFLPNDPRAYLLQLHHTSDTSNTSNPNSQTRKLKRRKTSLLPLETIPTNEYLHDLIFTLPTTTKQSISHQQRGLAVCDEYIRSGKEPSKTRWTSSEARIWSSTLRELVLRKFGTVDDRAIDVPILELEARLQQYWSHEGA